jgi:hypothetical protein
MCTLKAFHLTKYTMCTLCTLGVHCAHCAHCAHSVHIVHTVQCAHSVHTVHTLHTVHKMCTLYAHCAHCSHWIYHDVALEQIQFFWLSSHPCHTGSLPQLLLIEMIEKTSFGCWLFPRRKFHIGMHIKSMNFSNKLSSVHI